MVQRNPIQEVKDSVVEDHLRRRKNLKPVTPTGKRRDLRRSPRTGLEAFFKANDIRPGDLG